MPPTTFAALLAARTRATADPGRPLVTWYGATPGERVELSVTSWANWVAKTASLLQDELDLGRGDRVLLDLPSHWLGPVWLGACWTLGAVAVAPGTPDDTAADLVVCGPDGVERHAGAPVPVVASALNALGTRFTEPLPAGVVDFGETVWGQPDAFTAWDPPSPDDVAWEDAEGRLTQAEVVALAGDRSDDRRVATTGQPVSRAGISLFVRALAGGGGSVWLAEADARRLAEVAETERAQPASS